MDKRTLITGALKETSGIGSCYKTGLNDRRRKPFGPRISLIAIMLVLMLMVGAVAYNAPHFFACADKPVKSDAVILLVGSDSTEREKEARSLLNEGYARFLIVPVFHQVFTVENVPPDAPVAPKHKTSSGFSQYPRFYENTHLEVLQAKKMMNTMGLRSAIMVSSPYHMKRIKMVCERTFGEQARYISYVPTPYEHSVSDLRNMNLPDVDMAIMEYIKICWFHLYSLFI